jgi:RNA polymerase sigma factor (sigma-70 family)
MTTWPPPREPVRPPEVALVMPVCASPTTDPSAPPAVDPAFDAFFRANVGAMMRTARLITGSSSVGEEIVQDAFSAIYNRWASLDEPAGYLRTSVVNRSRSYLRHEGVVSRNRTRLEVATEAVTDVYPSDEGALEKALDRLNDRQRAAVVLKFWADYPEKEIAQILECRPGTVKSMLSRALSDLRKVVAP